MTGEGFKGIISSDWNQCLAPCGPFDAIAYTYPELTSDLTAIFEEYTGNRIGLGRATEIIRRRLPEPLSIQQMDAYLDHAFLTYKGVPDLVEWCLKNKILFMINTTGPMGYFQRVFAKKLLAEVPVISASAMIRYPVSETDPSHMYALKEIQDKEKHTEAALSMFGISAKKLVIMGDSGGDGPHFEWGKKQGAYLIGTMAKPSLTNYCAKKDTKINLLFGPVYKTGEERDGETEMLVDFMELAPVLEVVFA
jgi:hypothetical protein